MDPNPLKAQLKALDKTVAALHRRHDTLVADLDWFDGYDEHSARLRAAQHIAKLADLEQRRTALSEEHQLHSARTQRLTDQARPGWNPTFWFSEARSNAKATLRAHRQNLDELAQARADLQRIITREGDALARIRTDLAKYETFDRPAVESDLATIKAEIPLRQLERDELAVRKQRTDRMLKVPLKERDKFQRDRDELTGDIAHLELSLSTLERDISEAEDLDVRLSRASSGYDRAMLHQQCERQFGDSSPRSVIRDRRAQINRTRGELAAKKRHRTAIDRNLAKLDTRIEHIADLATREIRGIVIDGNNLCYQGQDFIGLAALRPLCRNLAAEYTVTVVFDASIRQRLTTDDNSLARALPGTTVHVVASRTSADQTILHTAQDRYLWVLSNDRFAEYPDKLVVADHRLLRHEILNGRILVHDLDLDEPFTAR